MFPAGGSLGGGTDVTVTGDFFEEPVQVTAAGERRNVLNVWWLFFFFQYSGHGPDHKTQLMLADTSAGVVGLTIRKVQLF